ncbi:MAG: DUF2807 domain-containing protein [Flavobacteriaceae bacterium]|nr:DUF2807 domain-containing protein [Flavobacteriaceae bacterium]
MRHFIYISILIVAMACNSEKAPNCLQSQGDLIQTEMEVAPFMRIRIEDDVSLIIRQGPVQEVIIETGSNLLNDVEVTVEGETLVVRDHNRCNLVRDFGITTAIVTTPDLLEIRNSSEFHVRGEGVLSFPFLTLTSNTTGGIEGSRKSGDFTLRVECKELRVAANGFSAFYISGFAQKAVIGFEDEVPRFEGADLFVNDLLFLQRSANVMIVNPLERLRGEIFGIGNVISVNRPPIVEVEEFYTGRLIFQD